MGNYHPVWHAGMHIVWEVAANRGMSVCGDGFVDSLTSYALTIICLYPHQLAV